MFRTPLAFVVMFGMAFVASAADTKPAKSQMVKGSVKSVNADAGVLVVAQELKNEKVDRQLSITKDVTWEITTDGKTETYTGKEGLKMLDGKAGAKIQVKCDKDVNVISIKVTIAKK